jgi:hypothetical protein
MNYDQLNLRIVLLLRQAFLIKMQIRYNNDKDFVKLIRARRYEIEYLLKDDHMDLF